MIFRPTRSSRGEDRLLYPKMLVFALGAALGVVGIARDIGWMVYTAIAILAIGLLLRLLSARQG